MRFIAKAKPVRIRLFSGGIDHSNILSLREHYCFKDLVSLPSGNLLKWLRQQNDKSLYQKMELYLHGEAFITDDTDWEFEKIIFDIPENVMVEDDIDMIRYWESHGYHDNTLLLIESYPMDDLKSLSVKLTQVSDDVVRQVVAEKLHRMGDTELASSLGYEVPEDNYAEKVDPDSVEYLFVKFKPNGLDQTISGWKRLFIRRMDLLLDGKSGYSYSMVEVLVDTITEQPYRQFVNYVSSVCLTYEGKQHKKYKFPSEWQQYLDDVTPNKPKTLSRALLFIRNECERLW